MSYDFYDIFFCSYSNNFFSYFIRKYLSVVVHWCRYDRIGILSVHYVSEVKYFTINSSKIPQKMYPKIRIWFFQKTPQAVPIRNISACIEHLESVQKFQQLILLEIFRIFYLSSLKIVLELFWTPLNIQMSASKILYWDYSLDFFFHISRLCYNCCSKYFPTRKLLEIPSCPKRTSITFLKQI